MSRNLILPFFPYEVRSRSREEIKSTRLRNREKIRVSKEELASFRRRFAETSVRASKRAADTVRRSAAVNRRISQQVSALAAVEYLIAEERARDHMQRATSRLESQVRNVREDSRRRVRAAASGQQVRGRFHGARRGILQARSRLSHEISLTRNSIGGVGRSFDRARAMMLGGRQNFGTDCSNTRKRIQDRRKFAEDSRGTIVSERAVFENAAREAAMRLHRGGHEAERLMARNLSSGAERFEKETESKRGEIAEKRWILRESISAADRRFELRGEEARKERFSVGESTAIAVEKKYQLAVKGKEPGRKFRESIDTARKSFLTRAAEKEEIMARRSDDVMKQAQIRMGQMKSNITNHKTLFLLDVRFAQHNLREASGRLRIAGSRAAEQLAERRDATLRRARAAQKARLIRNALALIRSTS